MMDDFGETFIYQAVAALRTSYEAPGTGTSPSGAGPPSYYGPSSPAFQPSSESYRVPANDNGVSNILAYSPLSRLRFQLQNRNEIDPRQDEFSATEYEDSIFVPLEDTDKPWRGDIPLMMEYISTDGSHHAVNRRDHHYPGSNSFYKRSHVLDTNRHQPVYSRSYSRVASPV